MSGKLPAPILPKPDKPSAAQHYKPLATDQFAASTYFDAASMPLVTASTGLSPIFQGQGWVSMYKVSAHWYYGASSQGQLRASMYMVAAPTGQLSGISPQAMASMHLETVDQEQVAASTGQIMATTDEIVFFQGQIAIIQEQLCVFQGQKGASRYVDAASTYLGAASTSLFIAGQGQKGAPSLLEGGKKCYVGDKKYNGIGTFLW